MKFWAEYLLGFRPPILRHTLILDSRSVKKNFKYWINYEEIKKAQFDAFNSNLGKPNPLQPPQIATSNPKKSPKTKIVKIAKFGQNSKIR